CIPKLVTKKNGKFVISAKRSGATKYLNIESDQLLLATGRVPNSDTLNLSKTGVEVDEDGYVKVDKTLETSVKGIFALGDIIGRFQFRHSANLEAQYAYYNILNHKKKIPVDYSAMPHAIFSSPQVAGVGYTEQELKRITKKEYVKSIYRYIDTAMGKALDDREGFVKLLVSKENRKILGCHILTYYHFINIILTLLQLQKLIFSVTSITLPFGLNLEKLFLIYTLNYTCDRKIQKNERKTFQKFQKTKDYLCCWN